MIKRNGITMIVLILTIVVIVIIAGATIATSGTLIENSKVTSFAEDLKTVEDATKLYYIENDNMPVLGENVALSYGQIKDMVDVKALTYFETETTENGDKPESDSLGAFYIIDLSKIGVTKITRGVKSNGNESDVFVVSYPSMNVYYLKGLSTRSKVYFSLIREISNVTKINKGDITNINTDVVSSYGITVRKENKTWTNKPNFLVEASLENGEELYIKFGDSGSEKVLNTQIGQNSLYFSDTLKSYTSYLANQKYNLSITDSEISAFNSLPQNQKYFEVIKKKSGSVVGSVKVDFSNYETSSPVKSAETVFTPKEEYNTITISVNDTLSGVKDVKYEYLTKIDKDGNIIKYYKDREGRDITSFDSDYMLARGKSAGMLSEGTYTIDIPKDVEGIEVMVYDKAGNSFLMTENTNIQNTDVGLWAGIFEKYVSNSQVFLDFTVRTNYTINEAKIQLSEDGSIYNYEKFLDFTKIREGVFISTSSFNNLNLYEYVYAKLIIKYNNSKTETIIKKIKVRSDNDYDYVLPGVTVLGDNKSYTDSNGEVATIPKGFRISENVNEQNIDTGLVVIAPDDSEFVWVPVPEDELALFAENDGTGNMRGVLWQYSKYGDINGDRVSYSTNGLREPDVVSYDSDTNNLNQVNSILGLSLTTSKDLKDLMQMEYNNIYNSVVKYHGFYVGRYETGDLSLNNVSSKKGNTDISNQTWYTMYAKQKKYALNLNGTSINSNMIYGSQWDAIMRWFSKSSDKTVRDYPINSEEQGNYSSSILPSGNTISVNNIFDMASNYNEVTAEASSTNRTIRGGNYLDKTNSYAGFRNSGTPVTSDAVFGTRLSLYL